MDKPRRRASLFVFETAAAVLIFSLACALCVPLFVRAHIVSRESGDALRALALAQNAAELWRAYGDDAFTQALGLRAYTDGTLYARLTQNAAPAETTEGYLLFVTLQGEDTQGVRRAQFCVRQAEDTPVLFSLDAAFYTPMDGGRRR